MCIPFLHKYSKWVDKRTIDVYDISWGRTKNPTHREIVQEKRCEKCNKLKIRKVKF